MSSISSSRPISSGTAVNRGGGTYKAAEQGGAFVEHIDTTNNVFVRNDLKEHHKNPRDEEEKKQENEDKIVSQSNYIPNALEALIACGVYDEEDKPKADKVNAYAEEEKDKKATIETV